MPVKKVTDLTALTTIADDDLVMVVDVSDTTGSADGTSKKITKANLTAGLGGEQQVVLNGSFFDVSIRNVYMPLGNSELENGVMQRYTQYVTPFAGVLKRVVVRTNRTGRTTGTFTMTLRELSETSNAVTDIEAITFTPASYASYMTLVFDFTSAAVMQENRAYGLYLTNGTDAATGNVAFTALMEST